MGEIEPEIPAEHGRLSVFIARETNALRRTIEVVREKLAQQPAPNDIAAAVAIGAESLGAGAFFAAHQAAEPVELSRVLVHPEGIDVDGAVQCLTRRLENLGTAAQ